MLSTRSSLLVLVPVLGLSLLAGCEADPKPMTSDAPPPAASAPTLATAAKAATTKAADVVKRPGEPAKVPAPPDVAAPPKDAVKTASGLASNVLAPGKGKDHPGATDTVKVRYTGWTKDGTMFDSSGAETIGFRLDQVIKGWTEGVALMTPGEKRRLWIPAALAYGDHPRMGAPAGDLTFDIELVDMQPAPKPPPVPEDVKAPPATAKKTASGLAYRVLTKGKGTRSPSATDAVTVHYSGWTTDGKMFDSSVVRGEPATFPLNHVIKGWTEGVQLMHEGDKVRFWIPGNLAYGDKPTRPGAPAGMLVFDIELLSIH